MDILETTAAWDLKVAICRQVMETVKEYVINQGHFLLLGDGVSVFVLFCFMSKSSKQVKSCQHNLLS